MVMRKCEETIGVIRSRKSKKAKRVKHKQMVNKNLCPQTDDDATMTTPNHNMATKFLRSYRKS